MFSLIFTLVTFYGGLIALGFLTKWYIPLVLFAILLGHGNHLDALFLRRKDLRLELAKLALEDLQELEQVLAEVHADKDKEEAEERTVH